MEPFVKKFIETNIEAIQSADWETVFETWYNKSPELWPDTSVVKEFLLVLTTSGITFDELARTKVIFSKIKDIIVDVQQNQKQGNWEGSYDYISRSYIENRLDSHLGYTYDELSNIMDMVASTLNMTYDGRWGYRW